MYMHIYYLLVLEIESRTSCMLIRFAITALCTPAVIILYYFLPSVVGSHTYNIDT